MTDESKGFIRNSLVLLVTTTIASAIHYLFQFAMGRMLGPADYGILAVLFSINYIILAPAQAVQLTLTKFVAEFRARNKQGIIKEFLLHSAKKLLLASAAIFVIISLLSAKIAEFLNIPQPKIVFMFAFIFLGIWALAGVRGFLQGLQKFKALGTNLISESVVKLVLSLILVFMGFGVAGAIWGVNISVFAAFCFAIALLFKMLKKYSKSSMDSIKKSEIYLYSMPMLIAISAITALYSIDVILVKHFFSPTEAGIYSAASLVAKVIFFGLLPVSQAMFPKIAELKAKSEDYKGVFTKALLLAIGLSSLATAVYYIAPNIVLSFLFGPAYSAAIPLIGLFGVAISLMSISYVFINYFLASGKMLPVYILPVFVIAEAALIWFRHASLYQVLTLITVIMTAMLAVFVIIYFITKEIRNETVTSNPSI